MECGLDQAQARRRARVAATDPTATTQRAARLRRWQSHRRAESAPSSSNAVCLRAPLRAAHPEEGKAGAGAARRRRGRGGAKLAPKQLATQGSNACSTARRRTFEAIDVGILIDRASKDAGASAAKSSGRPRTDRRAVSRCLAAAAARSRAPRAPTAPRRRAIPPPTAAAGPTRRAATDTGRVGGRQRVVLLDERAGRQRAHREERAEERELADAGEAAQSCHRGPTLENCAAPQRLAPESVLLGAPSFRAKFQNG